MKIDKAKQGKTGRRNKIKESKTSQKQQDKDRGKQNKFIDNKNKIKNITQVQVQNHRFPCLYRKVSLKKQPTEPLIEM